MRARGCELRAPLCQLRRAERLAQLKRCHHVVEREVLRDTHLAQLLESLQEVLVACLQQLARNLAAHLGAACVDVVHHGLKHVPRNVRDLNACGLLLAVPAVEHGAEGVRAREQRDAVRMERAALDDKRDVSERRVVHVLRAEVDRLGRLRRHAALGAIRRADLAHELQQRCRRVLAHARLHAHIHQCIQQQVEPALLHKHGTQLALGRQPRKRHGRALLHHAVTRAQHEHDVRQHPPAKLLLHALEQSLQHALLDNVRDVVLVICEPIERKRRVMLQVVVLALQQRQQRHQAPALHNARLVVRVLSQPAESKRCHLAQRRVGVRQHRDKRRHRAALYDACLGVRVCRRKLAQQQRGLALAVGAWGVQQVDDRLQRAILKHLGAQGARRGVGVNWTMCGLDDLRTQGGARQ
eukprot:350380-Chlamydomonas_euryale.AAC.4